MTAQDDIAPDERLGRGVFSSRNRDRSRRGTVPYHVFLEKAGKVDISVDRIGLAPATEAIRIADGVAAARGRDIPRLGRSHRETSPCQRAANDRHPATRNPYHADIVLPTSAKGIENYRNVTRMNSPMHRNGANAPAEPELQGAAA